MVISPPFLPVSKPGESEADWMARAMQQQVALRLRETSRYRRFSPASSCWRNWIYVWKATASGCGGRKEVVINGGGGWLRLDAAGGHARNGWDLECPGREPRGDA